MATVNNSSAATLMESIFEISKYFTHTFACSCRALETLLVIFITAQYFKDNSKFRSAYFLILNIGYVTDLVMFAHWLWPMDQITYLFTIIFHEWHNTYFLSIWNAALCCNRCTALAFPLKHEKIWTFKTMCFIVPLMIFFPFIIDGYELFLIECNIKDLISTCVSFRISYYFKATIVNVIVNIFGILFIIFSMYKSSKLKYHTMQDKIERRLIYQAIFSSIFQLIYFLLNGISTFISSDIKTLYLVGYFSQIIYHFHHYAVMITHFIFSPIFKIAFFNFYHISFLLKNKNATKVVIIPSRVQTISSRLPTV